MKNVLRKMRIFLVVLALLLCVCVLVACNEERPPVIEGDSPFTEQPGTDNTTSVLTLATNIEAAGNVSGGGRFAYNDDLNLEATINSGYYFLGWYYGTDLLSTSPVYNCKMWDRNVTLEAKYVELLEGYDGSGSLGNVTNQIIRLPQNPTRQSWVKSVLIIVRTWIFTRCRPRRVHQ